MGLQCVIVVFLGNTHLLLEFEGFNRGKRII